MIALLIFLSFIAFGIWAYKADKKDNQLREAAAEQEYDTWLKEQNALPKSRVCVHVKGLDAPMYSEYFEPKAQIAGFRYTIFKWTSKERAQAYIESIFKFGRFDTSDGVYFPVSEIEAVEIVEG